MFQTPAEASRAFAGEIGAGNLDAAVRCFADRACFVSLDGTPTRGRSEIRVILAQMIAADTRIEIEESSALIGDDVALGSERWRIQFRDVHGTPFRQASPARTVLRRLGENWTLAIAAPWGWGEYGQG
jgi:ketosteroid isomerase-like protein